TESFGGAGQGAGSIGDDPLYLSSLYPALGINTLVGGKRRENGEIVNQDDVVSRTSLASTVLVFASAGDGVDDLDVNGYMTVNPPNSETVGWGARASQWTSESNPIDFGHVDFRYSGKAVCAFLDGSVKLQSPAELSDMQLWCRNAAEESDPD